MKQTTRLIGLTLWAAAVLAAAPLFGQYSRLSLDIEVTLFASDEGRGIGIPAESAFGAFYAKGILNERFTSERLGRMFHLKNVRSAGEEHRDLRWPAEEISGGRIVHGFRLEGREFLLVLVPVKVDFKEDVYSFKAEVYERGDDQAYRTIGLNGPVVDLSNFGLMGFAFKDKTYFLTVTLVNAGWGASVPRPPFISGPAPGIIKTISPQIGGK